MPDLRHADDDVLLEHLARAFEADGGPPASGLVSLLVALEEQFGDAGPDRAPVLALSRRATRLVLAAAAALVALAVGLAWAGWPPQPGAPSNLDQLRYATTSLQDDLAQGDDPAQVSLDVSALARLLDQVPAGLHAQVGARPGRVMTTACVHLSGSVPPGTALPAPCGSILALPAVRQAIAGAAGGHGAATAGAENGVGGSDGRTDDGTDGSPTLWYVTQSATGTGDDHQGTAGTTTSRTTSAPSAGTGTWGEDGTPSGTSGTGTPTTVGSTPAGTTGTTAVTQPPQTSQSTSDDHWTGTSTTTVPSGTHLDN